MRVQETLGRIDERTIYIQRDIKKICLKQDKFIEVQGQQNARLIKAEQKLNRPLGPGVLGSVLSLIFRFLGK